MSGNYQQKDGDGVLFKNGRKEGDKDRDYQGTIKIGGREYWLSAWINESPKGQKYMKLSAKPKEPRPEQREQQPAQTGNTHRPDEFGDSIPF